MKKISIKRKSKKAVSGIIAVVLLIAITLTLGSVVYLWMKSFVKEATVKSGKNIELVCEDISFRASYASETKTFLINNYGNIPLSGMKIKVSKIGSFQTMDMSEFSEGGSFSLSSGKSLRIENIKSPNPLEDAISLTFIPVIRGKTQAGQIRDYVCPEGYGVESDL